MKRYRISSTWSKYWTVSSQRKLNILPKVPSTYMLFTAETLRKYPPVPLLFRRCSKSYKVPDSDFVVEKGLMTFIPTYAFHHDPEFFPNPQKFDPERFSEENKKKLVPNTYLPFGEGPRVCIGK